MRACIAPLLAATFATLVGCGPRDSESELRALVDAAVTAAEARDTGFFRDAISVDYVDRRGQRRDDLVNMLRAYFLLNPSVAVVNRIESIAHSGADAATIVLQSAIIGRAAGQSLLSVDGDLFRIELELVLEDGDWRIIGADWNRLLQ